MSRIDDGGGGPHWVTPPTPPGIGEPHPPSGGFSVQCKDLLSASHSWDDVSAGLVKMRDLAISGWGYPGIFGMADQFFTVGRLQESFNEKICNAGFDGSIITGYIANGLVEVANDYSHTDTTTAANFQSYEREY